MTGADTVAAFGAVAGRLRKLIFGLNGRPDVSEVLTRTDLTEDPPAVEWFVDAELTAGEALSWRLLAYWRDATWTIEADISRVQRAGSITELRFDDRTATDGDLYDALLKTADDLVAQMTFGVAD